MRRAEIGVEKDNPRARMLYERLGYSPAGERKETYGYTTPDGYIRRATVDQWMLAKVLS